MNNFYVYMYLREDGSPYYVGKGKEKRAYVNHGRVSVPIDKSRIEFVSENMTNDDAIKLEIELIEQYGRKDNGTGILHNMTMGGDGLKDPGPETLEKMSQNNKAGITGMLNKTHSSATLQQMSVSAKKRGFTVAHREKISESLRGKKEDPEVGKRRGLAISKAKKGKSNGREGIKHSEETKRKQSETQKGKPWSAARRQAQLDKRKQ